MIVRKKYMIKTCCSVHMGHGKPGKPWNLRILFSRPGKSWKLVITKLMEK